MSLGSPGWISPGANSRPPKRPERVASDSPSASSQASPQKSLPISLQTAPSTPHFFHQPPSLPVPPTAPSNGGLPHTWKKLASQLRDQLEAVEHSGHLLRSGGCEGQLGRDCEGRSPMDSLCVFHVPHGQGGLSLQGSQGTKAPKDKTSNSLFVFLICGCFSNRTAYSHSSQEGTCGG